MNQGSGQRRLREGIEAAKSGNRVLARDRLLEAVQQDSDQESAWWWLAQVADDQREQMRALENVLRLNPEHAEAQQALVGLRQKRLAARNVKQPDWETILPQSPLESDDGADDPYQCPYCGRPAGAEHRRCPHCGEGLYARAAPAASPGALSLVMLLLRLGLAAGVLELATPFIALGVIQSPANAALLRPLLDVFAIQFLLGNIQEIAEPAAWQTLQILLVRLGLLTAAMLGLSQRLTLAYFAVLLVWLADLLASIYFLIQGSLGLGAAAFNLIVALIGATALVGLSDQFAVHQRRLVVKPDGTARSALDFYKRGVDYQRRGMWAMAVAQWRKAVGLAPRVPDFYKHLGMGYAQIQRFDRSLRALKEAQRQAPEDADIAEIIRLVETKAERHALLRQ